MSVFVFLITLGLVARVTRLVNRDYITRHFRAFVYRHTKPDSDLDYGISCPWCASIWIAGVLFTVAYFYGHTAAYVIVAAAFTASHLVGLTATWFDPTED